MLIIKKQLLTLLAASALSFGAQAAAWNYDTTGDTGPDYWGDLSAEYHMCKDGMKQSPIDISKTQRAKIGELHFNYQSTPLSIKNNGHTLQVDYVPGSSLRIGKDIYQLLQFHFHTPSEHTKDGAAALMEAHFVHVNSDGQLVVIGVMLDEGRANPLLQEILENAPHEIGTEVVEGATVHARELMPGHEYEAEDFYNYSGSLTTPPCSEGVRWFVLKHRMTVSHEQAEEIAHFVHGGNARPVQPLNDRRVYNNND